ncbi:MAG: GTP-binding protein [Methanoregula sp.]|jgi:sulfate adenylyltransferase large subunit
MDPDILEKLENRDLMRLVIIGSVDDGKSTLLGRLLYDSSALFEDQIRSVKEYSQKNREQPIDFSLFTDGLKAEREQGITIDVAYRYFSTISRRYIIADTPGHEQYTRNMITGASLATVAVILVDATRGVMTQTRRHSFLSTLLGIRHVVVAINKMDLAGFRKEVSDRIVQDYLAFSEKFRIESIQFIPVCASGGDNIAHRSTAMPWYTGPSLLEYLDSLHIPAERNLIDLRFPVQMAKWDGGSKRGYLGSIASGILRTGDEILVLPSMKKSRVEKIVVGMDQKSYAFSPQAVSVYLSDELDIGRGDMIVREANVPCRAQTIEAILVWLDEQPLQPGRIYPVKHTTRLGRGSVVQIRYCFEMNSFHRHPAVSLSLNQIGKVVINLMNPFFMDEYAKNRQTGSFILIDPVSNQTCAAGMVSRCTETAEEQSAVKSTFQRGETYWVVGSPADERSLVLLRDLREDGRAVVSLDADAGLFSGLLPVPDPTGNAPRVALAQLCRLINDSGVAVVVRSGLVPDASARAVIGEIHLFIVQ